MAGLYQTLIKLLTYQGPRDIEGFELLEDKVESSGRQESQDPAAQEDGKANQKTPSEKKLPLTIDQWNESKKRTNSGKQPAGKTVTGELTADLAKVKLDFNVGCNRDVIIREFKVARKLDAFILYIDGMADKTIINNLILRQLMTPEHFDDLTGNNPVDYITDSVLSINQVTRLNKFEEIFQQVLNGLTALFIQGCDEAILIESSGFEKRNVDKPSTENIIRGSQEGFTENLRTNITLIRKIIKNKNLTTEILLVGKTGNSNCAVMYLAGITEPAIIHEVKRRIKSLNIDFVVGDGMLEELIADQPYSIFLQLMTTERPDLAATQIMRGKVVIIMDGTPFAAAVPTSFFEGLQSPEDFSLKWQFGTFLRVLRYLGLFTTIFLSGLYVALTLYHQEMLPPELLNSIARSRENVPFPTIIEILIMEISFELIREAGLRVPGVIGNTLGIIGALILGQAAVAANIVSPILIIIVAVGGLGSFAIPNYSLSFSARIQRFVFIFLGAIAGFYGIATGIVVLGCIACSTKSFGVPQFAPVAPATRHDLDLITMLPQFRLKERPDFVNPIDRKRQGNPTRGWIKKKGTDKNDQGR